MAAGNASRILRAPGRLVASPSDLSLDYPYGGVEVGKTRLVVLMSLGTPYRVECEGLGGEVSDMLEAPSRFVFSCFLRGWDDEAIEKFFAYNFVQGSVSGHAVLREPGLRFGGRSALGRAVSLLYVPDDPIHAPACLIYRGIPDWSDGAELDWQRQEELGIPLAVDCVRGATGKMIEVGRLADLSLT
jgi:hypothetical protein